MLEVTLAEKMKKLSDLEARVDSQKEVQAVKTGEKKESRIGAPKTSTELGIPKTETSLRKFGKQ